MAMRDLIKQTGNHQPVAHDPMQLHPAAQKAAVAYHDALTENERLRAENQRLNTELELTRQHNISLQRQLSAERRTCEQYRSYAVEVRTHLGTIMQVTTTAHEKGVAFMARTSTTAAEPELERQIADAAVENVQQEQRDGDVSRSP